MDLVTGRDIRLANSEPACGPGERARMYRGRNEDSWGYLWDRETLIHRFNTSIGPTPLTIRCGPRVGSESTGSVVQ